MLDGNHIKGQIAQWGGLAFFIGGRRQMQFISRILIFCIGIFLCSIQAQAAYFLDVGGYSAAARGVSADGSVVVGINEGPRIEAFLRTQYGDMVDLGDLSGGTFSS